MILRIQSFTDVITNSSSSVFVMQSANPVGKERIIDFLTGWKKYYESKNS